MKLSVLPSLLALAVVAACSDYSPTDPNQGPPAPVPTVFVAVGDSAAVNVRLGQFRTALGGVANTAPTPQTSGRREINWDGVPAAVTNVDTFPASFFNVNVKRGAVFTTPGSGFRVDSTNFGATNISLAGQFNFFSSKKTFMPVGSNQLDVHFQLVGSPVPGVVNGFGVIFSDVDRVGSTRVEFFDVNGVRLAVVEAPARGSAKEFAFVGATFTSSIVARVRIVSGQAGLTATLFDLSDGGANDLVIMDDYVFGEPKLTPQ